MSQALADVLREEADAVLQGDVRDVASGSLAKRMCVCTVKHPCDYGHFLCGVEKLVGPSHLVQIAAEGGNGLRDNYRPSRKQPVNSLVGPLY